MKRTVIIVDFDGTLTENDAWPEVGRPRWPLINELKRSVRLGHQVVLFTCRNDPQDTLGAATEFCHLVGLELAAVNENTKDRVDAFGCDCRKISGDVILDDKAIGWSPGMAVKRIKRINDLTEEAMQCA